MDLQIETYDIGIELAVAHHDPYHQGIAAAAYAGHAAGDGFSTYFWGFGGVKNTETFYLEGIVHGINIGLPHVVLDEYSVLVWVLSDGFTKYIREYAPKWIANGGRKRDGSIPDAYPSIKQCYVLFQLGRLCVNRTTPKRGGKLIGMADSAASRLATTAYERGAFRRVGIAETGSSQRGFEQEFRG